MTNSSHKNRFYFLLLATVLSIVIGCRQPLVQTAPAKGNGSTVSGLVNKQALDELLVRAEETHSDAIVILRDGKLVGAWHSGGVLEKIETMSITKSVLNLAIGRLITLGKIDSIDQPVHSFFPEWNQGLYARVTLRHLLTHTSGLQANITTEKIYASRDFVDFALHSDIVDEPGSKFFYNNKAVNLLAGIAQNASGKPLDAFLRDDLFAELGISDFDWQHDRAGNPHGMSGLQIRPEDLARLGQFTLDRGKLGEKQLIDESWFDRSFAPGSSLNPYYGLLWWLSREIISYTIDDEHISALREAGVDEQFLTTVQQKLKGHYESWEAYRTALEKALGADYTNIINKELLPLRSTPLGLSRKEFGRLIGYRAEGDLGQFLVAYPREKLVGVRMIEKSFFPDRYREGFGDFPDRLLALAR